MDRSEVIAGLITQAEVATDGQAEALVCRIAEDPDIPEAGDEGPKGEADRALM